MTNPNFREQVQIAFDSAYPDLGIYGTYCLVTGKLIGESNEIDDLIRSLEGMDPEEAADDIAIRIFSAMRPSLFWNKMTLDSVAKYQFDRPAETLAWLLNRLMNPVNFKGDIFAIHHERIQTYQWCVALESGVRQELITQLISLDARLSLNSQLWDGGFSALSFETLEAWVNQAVIRANKLEKARDMQTRWYRDGNTQSKAADVTNFWTKRAESPTHKVKTEKQKTATMMDNMLATLMADAKPIPAHDPLAASSRNKPIPAPTLKPKPTGLSFLKKKKEA